jgi:hypothetical protein
MPISGLTVGALLTNCLNLIGANAAGETPDADDQTLALFWANLTLDALSAMKLSLVTGIQQASYNLTGAASYTLGPSETWNNTTPIKIKAAQSFDASGASMPVKVSPAEDWVKVTDQTRTGLFVEEIFYDDGFPYITVYVTPKPSAGSIKLYTYEALAQFTSWAEAISLYPGLADALLHVIALKLCFPFGRAVPDGLVQLASNAMTVITSIFNEIAGTTIPVGQVAPMVKGEAD